jgi:uncharacterized protein (TIGR02001 family)
MKKFLLSGVALLCISGPALAEDSIPGDFSTTIGFVSEYSFRGIAQSDERPAVQGSIDWSHDSGFYAGVWGTNVDFNDGDEAQLETDLYAGYSGDLNGFSYDIGAIYYAYPGADSDLDYDFYEAAFALGYDFDVLAVSTALNYSPDYFAGSDDAVYLAAYVDVPLPFLPFETALNASVGHQWIDDNDAFGVEDYMDWGIGITSNIEGFDVGLRYIDTDLDEPDECADGCDQRVILSLSKSLP